MTVNKKRYGTGADKHIEGKERIDLVPPEAILAMGEVFEYGAMKYGDNNWIAGIPISASYAAAMRHMLKFYSGEDTDSESGINHMKHVLCNIAMIVYQIECGRKDLDDRKF